MTTPEAAAVAIGAAAPAASFRPSHPSPGSHPVRPAPQQDLRHACRPSSKAFRGAAPPRPARQDCRRPRPLSPASDSAFVGKDYEAAVFGLFRTREIFDHQETADEGGRERCPDGQPIARFASIQLAALGRARCLSPTRMIRCLHQLRAPSSGMLAGSMMTVIMVPIDASRHSRTPLPRYPRRHVAAPSGVLRWTDG